MAELVDAPDLGSGIERCAGSSPVPGTFKITGFGPSEMFGNDLGIELRGKARMS